MISVSDILKILGADSVAQAITLVLVAISATASLWAAFSNHRQTKLLKQQMERPAPIFEPTQEKGPWPGWVTVRIETIRGGPAQIGEMSISAGYPKGTRFLLDRDTFDNTVEYSPTRLQEPPNAGQHSIVLRTRAPLRISESDHVRFHAKTPNSQPLEAVTLTFSWADQKTRFIKRAIDI